MHELPVGSVCGVHYTRCAASVTHILRRRVVAPVVGTETREHLLGLLWHGHRQVVMFSRIAAQVKQARLVDRA